MIVWGRRNSVNVQKVMWAIGEVGIDYVRHDMAGSFGTSDAYLRLNPRGTVPTIQDDTLTLWESNACVRYIAQHYGKPDLYPAEQQTAAQADQWMDYQATVFSPAFFQIFLNRIRLPPERANDEQLQAGIRNCATILSEVDRHLVRHDYLAGERFSMADIALGAPMYRYFTMDIERPVLPGVEAWYQRLCARDAYQYHVMIPFGSNHEQWLHAEQANAGIQ